jgi:hypothetical protein
VRDDTDFADRFAMRHQLSHQRMAGFVVGDRSTFLLVHHPALFLGTGNDSFDGRLEVIHCDPSSLSPGSSQCCLIYGILQIRSAKPSCDSCGLVDVKAWGQSDALSVNLQDLYPANQIGIADSDLAIKAARPHKRRIEYLRAICGCHNDDRRAGVALEAVNLG